MQAEDVDAIAMKENAGPAFVTMSVEDGAFDVFAGPRRWMGQLGRVHGVGKARIAVVRYGYGCASG
jgi:hypothetical protein